MDLILLGLTMEGISLILYVLMGLGFNWEYGLEASIKYFSLGGVISAISWLGISLIYATTDTTQFLWLSLIISNLPNEKLILLHVGFLCLISSFFFKLSIFPIHIWTPEIYSGCHLTINAFLIIPIKIGYFTIFVRLLYYTFWPLHHFWQIYLTTAAIGSLLIGAILTLNEKNFKRFLATTSINQIGILLLGLSCCTWGGLKNTLFYFWIYIFTMLLFLLIILALSYNEFELIELSNFRVLSSQNKLGAFLLTITLLNMGGFPPTLGFQA